jgi:hypothetical protein
MQDEVERACAGNVACVQDLTVSLRSTAFPSIVASSTANDLVHHWRNLPGSANDRTGSPRLGAPANCNCGGFQLLQCTSVMIQCAAACANGPAACMACAGGAYATCCGCLGACC